MKHLVSAFLRAQVPADLVKTVSVPLSGTQGSAYVLLHHVMGEAAGKKGVWAYVQGGMGAVSESIAAEAR